MGYFAKFLWSSQKTPTLRFTALFSFSIICSQWQAYFSSKTIVGFWIFRVITMYVFKDHCLDREFKIVLFTNYFVYYWPADIVDRIPSLLGTIHIRRRQIFTIFDPFPPTIGIPAKCLWGEFLILLYCDLWTIGTWGHPSPPKTCWRLKWMVP